MNDKSADCTLEHRREDVRQSKFLGIDFVEVGPGQTTLEVFFLGRAPATLKAANVSITGGSTVSVAGVQVYRQRDPTLDDWMEVTVTAPGDFSDYTFALVELDKNGNQTDQPIAGLDQLFASATFNFKASCPTDLDCCAPQVCPPPARTAPDINYLAKDYASFLQLMLDRLAQTMPAWTETHVPDIGVMLVQLIAYVGDQLSYYQDAVATEAYLGTARERISVRRHARLVDYQMHEGCNARAWVTIATSEDITLAAGQFFFCTPFPGAPSGHVLQPADFAKAPPGSYQAFQPLQPDPTQATVLKQAHNAIQFYTWGNCACCLPVGATSATLLDQWVTVDAAKTRALSLAVNDVLIFEEVIGPGTGNPADADSKHRQAVRLTSVTQSVDPLYDQDQSGTPVIEIEWCSEDALTFPLCISAVMPPPDCTCKTGISLARGNVVLVDNGILVTETLGTVPTESSTPLCPTDCCPPTIVVTPGPFCPVLLQIPLTFAQPLPACYCATPVLIQDPRQALPGITLTGTVSTPQGDVTTTWTPLADLLESGPNDTNFVVEIDNAGKAHLRFGNGDEGKQPDAGTSFTAIYRIGNGTDGNVGAETIVNLVFTVLTETGAVLLPRNPLPASGGTAQESMADVRFFAPYAFQDVLERAITADDYATLAADNSRRLADRPDLMPPPAPAPLPLPPAPGTDPRESEEEEYPPPDPPLPADLCLIPFEPLQNAKCTLRWTGSWYEALVAVDPLGTETVADELLAEIDAYLKPYRRIGYDLAVSAPDYVALDLGLSICVAPNYLRGQIEAALLAALGTGIQASGKLALFNPDNLTFGQGVYVSPIIAAVQSIPGVVEVQLTRLAPYLPGTPAPTTRPDHVPKNGVLTLGPLQIPRLDNDPNAPTNGRLTLLLRGGR
jgi:hypothetical protein